MSAEFPDFFHSHWRPPPSELCNIDKDWIMKDWVRRDFKHGRSPYVINGVPVAHVLRGSAQFPCDCRSDVIFYNGKPYDQKYYLQARLRTRPCNVMFLEGKLIPPFNPGKSPNLLGPYRNRDKPPTNTGFNDNQFGKGLNPCCTTSIYNDTIEPYHNTKDYGFTRMGLPYGETIGFFRFKPKKICDCRQIPLQSLGQCCTCEPGEYNPAQYLQDECSPACCC